MATITSTETQPLLSHRLPSLTYTQKKALVFTLGTFQLFGGIYGMYHAATDRERTSFNGWEFTQSCMLTLSGSLTNLLCLKGIFPFEFRHPEPVQNVAEVSPPAADEPRPYIDPDFLNLKLDSLLAQCRIPLPDSSSDLEADITEKCTLLATYIETELQGDRAAAVGEVLKGLQALGQIKLTVGSRANSRVPSAHTTPAPSPVKKGRDTTPTNRYAPPASAPGSPGDVEKGTLGSAKKQD